MSQSYAYRPRIDPHPRPLDFKTPAETSGEFDTRRWDARMICKHIRDRQGHLPGKFTPVQPARRSAHLALKLGAGFCRDPGNTSLPKLV